ncbi:CDS1 [Enterospora canceri]|uniref:Phosphatidate cytidylyltransferase n=1 Tax=Enterospora canceri TaxID=1081671 RepID=A0A1Y1S870_9MICR|nr:CDS1 [Enterospora canceri]
MDIKKLIQSNFIKRSVFGAVMIVVFHQICRKDVRYLAGLIFAICLGCVIEILHLTKHYIHGFTHAFLTYYMAILLFMNSSVTSLSYFFPNSRNFILQWKPDVIGFYFYLGGFIKYIMDFTKKKLKKQMVELSLIHLSSTIMGATFKAACRNLARGKFYVIYPASLIICNDIFAYLVGKLFGRTPLFHFSPKKTVEGFLGAFVFTCITSYIFVRLKLDYNILPDKLDSVMKTRVNLPYKWLNKPALVYYNVAFVLAASFLAPFGGFLASVIKRFFKKKDFSTLFPGHGGVLDRMDCQLLMIWFTYYFLAGIVEIKTQTVGTLASFILTNFSEDEIQALIQMLRKGD